MRSGFSEFSYGYAVTEALIYDFGTSITAAPVFPSLIEEGQQGGGYDLRLDRPGQPLFLQFKLSDYMQGRGNTTEIKRRLFNGAFYRMHLRSSPSKQHQLLIDWESKGNEVYYAAPVFHELQHLNDAYLKRQILQKSVFFCPSDIGLLPDNAQHHIAFQGSDKAFLLSEPQEIPPPSNFEIFSERLTTRLFRNNERTVIDSTQRLLPELIELYNLNRRGLSTEEQSIYQFLDRFSNPLQQVAFLARVLFDCNYYIVQQRVVDIAFLLDF